MRTVKLLAIAIMLALAGAAYAARATEDAPKTQDAKTAKSCCQKHNAAPAAKDEGKACCGDSCSKEHHRKNATGEAESCCGADCCKAHKADAKQTTAQTTAAKDGDGDGCCSGSSCACCAAKSGHKAHAAGR